MGGYGNRGSNQSIDHENAFSRLELRLTQPNQQPHQINDRDMMEENLYLSQGYDDENNENWGRRAGKKWSVFIMGCFDLGCSTIAILMGGRTLISILVYKQGRFLITSFSCSLILSFFWFVAAWQLLESAYLRKRIIKRYQLARFWRFTNIGLLIIFIISSILATFCLFGNCQLGMSMDILQFLQTTTFRVLFIIGVSLACVERVVSIWFINKYVSELSSELSVDSLPLQVL